MSDWNEKDFKTPIGKEIGRDLDRLKGKVTSLRRDIAEFSYNIKKARSNHKQMVEDIRNKWYYSR